MTGRDHDDRSHAAPPDVLRRALLLMEEFGADAEVHAAMRVDELTEAGDLEGARAWRRVLAAVDDLRRMDLRSGETWH